MGLTMAQIQMTHSDINLGDLVWVQKQDSATRIPKSMRTQGLILGIHTQPGWYRVMMTYSGLNKIVNLPRSLLVKVDEPE